MKAKTFLLGLAGMVYGLSVLAQEMPAAQKNLMQFAGNWVCKNPKLIMGGKTYSGVYSFNCSAVNMNTGIIAHEKFVTAELTMVAENLIGYDPNLQQVHLYTIDNMGTAHDHIGYWIDERRLYLQYQGVVEGKMYVEQIDMVFKDANTLQLKLTAMLNGEIFETAEGIFLKQQ
jgi:hypothetical protein